MEHRLAAAVRLYETGQLSAGAAAQFAGVPKPYFLGRLGDFGVDTFDLTEEELIHDLGRAAKRESEPPINADERG